MWGIVRLTPPLFRSVLLIPTELCLPALPQTEVVHFLGQMQLRLIMQGRLLM